MHQYESEKYSLTTDNILSFIVCLTGFFHSSITLSVLYIANHDCIMNDFSNTEQLTDLYNRRYI